MRIACLILAHENASHLARLLDVLLDPDSDDFAVIHADNRSALWREIRDVPDRFGPRATIISDPVSVRWGHASMVVAMHRLIAAALNRSCDFAHLISGADWPVMSRQAIVAELEGEPGPLPCRIAAVPGMLEERMQTFRLDSRWLRLDPRKDRRAYAATWQLRRLSRWGDAVRSAVGLERSRPYGPWSKGSQWWSLPADVLAVVAKDLAQLERECRLAGTVCADEHVIQSIVASRFRDRLASPRRFVRFPEGHSSPRVLNASDVPAIKASGAWFMRKVDAACDPFFLHMPEAGTGVRPASMAIDKVP